ncbi:MAG: NUMOD1 domain-containing DNA-binding protein [Alphaproteobacteria bacterium]
MIVDNGRYYLYRYIRLDSGQPFYIGIGTKRVRLNSFKSNKSEYHRAYYGKRTHICKNIQNKTIYKIEILLESNDYEFIKEKEKEFIKLYGRIDLKTGCLANMTDGGEGTTNIVVSKSTKTKISNNSFNKGKFGVLSPVSKKLYQYDLEGNFVKEWVSGTEVKNHFKTTYEPSSCARNRTKSYKGYQWRYYKVENIGKIKEIPSYKTIPVYQYNSNGCLIQKYKSTSEIYNKLKYTKSTIYEAMRSESHYAYGSFWFSSKQDITFTAIAVTQHKHKIWKLKYGN